MSHESTENYGLTLPEDSSPMSDFETYLNGNWDKVTGVVAPNSVTGALPQTGGYNLYDRVYRTNDKSIYILIVKDASWGWHWRPVHAALSPWITVDTLPIYANASWDNAAASIVAVAYDNKGHIHWRGSFTRTAPMVYNTTDTFLINMPKGMYPSRSANFVSRVLTANLTAVTFGMVQFARISITGNDRATGTPGESAVRLFGGDSAGTQPSTVYMNFTYEVGASWYDV